MQQPASARRKTRSQRRLAPAALERAAIDPDDAPPADIDAFRIALARRINIIMSNRERAWRRCQERRCRRARACLAPRIQCSNAPPPAPDPDGRRLARTLAHLRRTMQEMEDRARDGA